MSVWCTRWVRSSLLGVIHLMTFFPGRPNQSQKIDLKFLITQLHHINQLLHDFCKAMLESAVSNSCLPDLPTPGPSVVPVNWLALPGRSKKWGWGVLSVSPLLQTPTGFPWQQLVTSLIFCLPAGCRRVGRLQVVVVGTNKKVECLKSCLEKFVPVFHYFPQVNSAYVRGYENCWRRLVPQGLLCRI